MKKKIILFLSVLFAAMFLTGCAHVTTAKEIKKLDEIANECATNGLGYKVPDGYEIGLPNAQNTGRIKITDKTNMIEAYYTISEEGVNQEKIVTNDDPLAFFVIFVFGFIIGVFVKGLIMNMNR